MHKIKNPKVISRIPIYVHSWGGLGSQLFALAFILQLRKNRISRRIILVHHTGGVTYRSLEESVLDYFKVSFKIVDDYQPPYRSVDISPIQRLRRIIRRLGSFLLLRIGFLVTSENSRLLVKPWTFVVRGHYYREKLPSEILESIMAYFQQHKSEVSKSACDYEEIVLIHQRLGDLMSLHNKGPVSMSRIVSVIASFRNQNNVKLIISSDSSDIALSQLSSALRAIKLNHYQTEAFGGSLEEFFFEGINSHVFIGSNSKISIWIALFRAQLGRSNTFLSSELRNDFTAISTTRSGVSFY